MTASARLPFWASLPGRTPFYYGWVNVCIAALAMVATLPGRTQGLGLIAEPLMRDFGLERVGFAKLNLWATLIGSLFCLGFGPLLDRFGARFVLTLLAAALGGTVVAMSQGHGLAWLAISLVLARGLGQSALSAASISLVGQWFQSRLAWAMAVYSVVLSLGFMIAFPLVGAAVEKLGWRPAWFAVGLGILLLAPVTFLLVRRSPENAGVSLDAEASTSTGGATLREALSTPAFWVFGVASALYLLVASGIGLFNESILAELGFPRSIYYQTLAVTALTALAGNFLGGWLGQRQAPGHLLGAAMALLAGGLVALPQLRSLAGILLQAVVMGVAGGFVTVIFFTFWSRTFGRRQLGRIQGAAQMLTVVASALGPLVLARCHELTGSYAAIFRWLAAVVGVFALAAVVVRLPGSYDPPTVLPAKSASN
jgi:MFS family permease